MSLPSFHSHEENPPGDEDKYAARSAWEEKGDMHASSGDFKLMYKKNRI